MKKFLPLLLCLLLLTGCNKTPETTESESPAPTIEPTASPAPEAERFPFTEENYPRVDGSTATIPLIEAVESVLLEKPRKEVTVSISKTSGAYEALAANRTDILLVYDGGDETRIQVNADELFETVPIGKDALIFVVNKENPVESITTEQVRKIFSGEYTNWSELGGSDEPIRAYQRGIGSGSQALMDKLVMKELPMANPAMVEVIESMGGLVDAVADYAGGSAGIGYNVFFYVTEMKKNDNIKLLSIDGVAPSYESIQSGEYPFVSEFYSVIRKSEPEDSPARALHEWMLTPEAQNLMASENYVALHEDPTAATPKVDGKYSAYPEGEEPVYLDGVDHYLLKASDDYGPLYFYLGSTHHEIMAAPAFYGLCTEDGKIVTEPIYTNPRLLIDSEGNKAYACYRLDKVQSYETVTVGDWSYEKSITPALLFATDGSWVMEFDGAFPSYVSGMCSDVMANSDIFVAKKDGKWGALNLNGEIVIPFNRDSSDGIYPSLETLGPDMAGAYAGITADRYLSPGNDSINAFAGVNNNLIDSKGKILAKGLQGVPASGCGDYIITSDWDTKTVYTYTLDGEPIASLSPAGSALTLGEYAAVSSEGKLLIMDRNLEPVFEFPGNFFDTGSSACGPGVLFDSDTETKLHRTYLPNGTRLVTWYDYDMYEDYTPSFIN